MFDYLCHLGGFKNLCDALVLTIHKTHTHTLPPLILLFSLLPQFYYTSSFNAPGHRFEMFFFVALSLLHPSLCCIILELNWSAGFSKETPLAKKRVQENIEAQRNEHTYKRILAGRLQCACISAYQVLQYSLAEQRNIFAFAAGRITPDMT